MARDTAGSRPAKQRKGGAGASASKPISRTKNEGKSKISDELRQAVMDLGGDDEDLNLIAGVEDDDEGDAAPVKPTGKAVNEVGLTTISST
jgi:ribosome biogenesis protein MAK21